MIYFYYYSNNSGHLYLAFGYRGFCGISLTSGLCRGRRVISFLVRCRLSLGRCVHIINCIIDLRSCTRRSLFWSWRLSNWRSGYGFPFRCSSFGYFFRDFWKRKFLLSINEQLSNAIWLCYPITFQWHFWHFHGFRLRRRNSLCYWWCWYRFPRSTRLLWFHWKRG